MTQLFLPTLLSGVDRFAYSVNKTDIVRFIRFSPSMCEDDAGVSYYATTKINIYTLQAGDGQSVATPVKGDKIISMSMAFPHLISWGRPFQFVVEIEPSSRVTRTGSLHSEFSIVPEG